jgi:uncharacterized cupin superfamily protein
MSTERRHPHVINLDEIPTGSASHGDKFAYTARRLAQPTAGKGLGCSWFEIAPGKTAFPCHWHSSNEEAIYILGGEGTMRLGEARVPVRAGDYIALPPGPAIAHQLINTSDAPLTYLCISTMNTVEVVGYPDSKKIAAVAVDPSTREPWTRKVYPDGVDVDYYAGED